MLYLGGKRWGSHHKWPSSRENFSSRWEQRLWEARWRTLGVSLSKLLGPECWASGSSPQSVLPGSRPRGVPWCVLAALRAAQSTYLCVSPLSSASSFVCLSEYARAISGALSPSKYPCCPVTASLLGFRACWVRGAVGSVSLSCTVGCGAPQSSLGAWSSAPASVRPEVGLRWQTGMITHGGRAFVLQHG